MMNTRNLALALVASGAAAGAAAQVTLGGVADAAVRHVDNEGLGSVSSLVSGSNATSRLIVRGAEDLGGGLSAGFHLEHGILLDSGSQASSTLFWDRRSTLSLTSTRLGELRAGRDFVPSYVGWSRYDPFGYVGVASSSNFVTASQTGPIRAAFGSNPNTTVRSSNSLQWLAPSGLGGVEGGVLVAAGEGGLAANGQHKVVGARVGYVQKAFGVSAAFTRSENDLTTEGAFKDTSLGGSWDFGVVRMSLAWRRFAVADAKQTNLIVGAWVPVGAVGEARLSFNRVDLSGQVGGASIDANDATQLGVGYVHNLSKRSAVYGTLARVANKGAATFAVAGGPSGLAGGNTSTGIEFGVRHSF
jgi:predicted porin